MKLPFVLRSEADSEFEDAVIHYERIRHGLGWDFAAEVQLVFDRIVANPLIHQVVFRDIRKGVVRRFPYCVYYRPHVDRIEVVSVFNTHRNPSIWQSRI